MSPQQRSNGCFWRMSSALVFASLALMLLPSSEAFDALDPTGNVTILWNINTWTGDGYIAQVNMFNYQKFRKINPPGWALNFTWTDGEIIWNMQGAVTTEQGNCSKIVVAGGAFPYCCAPTPTVMDKSKDALGEVPGCCKDGVLTAWAQDSNNSFTSWRLQVGNASKLNSVAGFKPPTNFTLLNDGYTCTEPISVTPTISYVKGARTQALVTLEVVCTYTSVVAKPVPACCVSLSAFYNDTIVPCASCACACGNYSSKATVCTLSGEKDTPFLSADVSQKILRRQPTARICSPDGCPVSIHYHIKQNYEDYWRAKITIINRELYNNWTDWNLAIEHPNFANLTEAFSFDIEQIQPFGVNNTAIMWGRKDYNKILAPAGGDGNVQSELLFAKVPDFTFSEGWAFPRRVVFNGEECVMPDEFPTLPNSASRLPGFSALLVGALIAFFISTVLIL